MNNETILQTLYKEILQIVSETPGIKKENLYDQLTASKGTKVKRLNEIIRMGLVTETKCGRYNIKILELTDAGRNVLEGIRIIDSAFAGEDGTNYGTPAIKGN